jgi:hypothetical protein
MLIMTIKLIMLFKKLQTKGLERSIWDTGEKRTLFDECKGLNMVKWTKKYVCPNPNFNMVVFQHKHNLKIDLETF